ncbi:hypothetical protein V2J09_019641 [Rumex salicifolius]
MRLEKCWFCSSTIYPGHGIQFVRNDAKKTDSKIFRFCRSKCHKNFKMKRNPRKVKWTKAYRRLHGKDMTQDSTFEFERKRNRPERYDRNLIQETLKAIPKIVKVRAERQDKHIEKRMKGKKAKVLAEERKELEQSISLVKAPEALRKDATLTLPKIKILQQQKAEENHAMEESANQKCCLKILINLWIETEMLDGYGWMLGTLPVAGRSNDPDSCRCRSTFRDLPPPLGQVQGKPRRRPLGSA